MTRVVFVQANGTNKEVQAAAGQSLMQVARAGFVPGIVAECGGELSCATCHVFVDQQWAALLPERSDDETEMLDVAAEEPTEFSRLSCQVQLNATLDGIVVNVPKSQ